jgi:hypothetical protein
LEPRNPVDRSRIRPEAGAVQDDRANGHFFFRLASSLKVIDQE